MQKHISVIIAVSSWAIAAAAEPSLVFPDAKIEMPPLSLAEAAKENHVAFHSNIESVTLFGPSYSAPIATDHIVHAPSSDVDFKLIIKHPDPSIDLKLIVKEVGDNQGKLK